MAQNKQSITTRSYMWLPVGKRSNKKLLTNLGNVCSMSIPLVPSSTVLRGWTETPVSPLKRKILLSSMSDGCRMSV
ncbi:hypothetical protein COEREDRAFT_82606 [Coemansia reversa NRRL 1564]|uniref:Uncharacterized protein n=1 Tax=Coemansia reversa (strain ATCC 12441 / NRRL 1564) TaxID=763665 RepID=A0A2G5B6F4_COERN|nr:hypothetical protein COEREDRAFT_82606 [Coemansia reversa NRRL 1564]|eukprot:PIA14572.1 hypothetical protein COEREDRAFT_82606 [Coemansia reversa NRRL 1564]